MGGLKAQVEKDGDILIVHFDGRIDVESAAPFRQACRTHLKGQKVVFNFSRLNFVGSAGILPFLEAMQEFADGHPNAVKFSGLGVEFGRVLAATSLHSIENWDTPAKAVFAYRHPQTTHQNALYIASATQPGLRSTVAATALPLLSLRYEGDDREPAPAVED